MNTAARRMLGWMLLSLAVALSPAAAAEIERTVALGAGGTVEIDVGVGSVRVIGWDRAEVEVSGTVGFDPELLEVRGSGDRVRVEAPVVEGRNGGADLVIRVPELGRLEIEGISCDVETDGVRAGDIRVEVVHGEVAIDATARRVDVESVSGSVRTSGAIETVRAETAAGRITIAGVRSAVAAETVGGPVEVTADAPLRSVDLSTANGRIRFTGGLTADGRLRAESMNGGVELTLDRDTRADVEIETYNGRIDVDWDGIEVAPGPDDRHGRRHGREARFALGGGGGARIEVDTFNGRCDIRSR